ncbi:uncharacterized protein LOC117113863 [Anneissia japonica]|uniref:uncharacterized protein LOC117113863 n=1 Tax=Anneissia japonica TaxID=1529436 RepID=UPI0014255CE4|nr:uncharacterized protein LOC117113863 [Anneissia japonica]
MHNVSPEIDEQITSTDVDSGGPYEVLLYPQSNKTNASIEPQAVEPMITEQPVDVGERDPMEPQNTEAQPVCTDTQHPVPAQQQNNIKPIIPVSRIVNIDNEGQLIQNKEVIHRLRSDLQGSIAKDNDVSVNNQSDNETEDLVLRRSSRIKAKVEKQTLPNSSNQQISMNNAILAEFSKTQLLFAQMLAGQFENN